jgi:hypothetical protein
MPGQVPKYNDGFMVSRRSNSGASAAPGYFMQSFQGPWQKQKAPSHVAVGESLSRIRNCRTRMNLSGSFASRGAPVHGTRGHREACWDSSLASADPAPAGSFAADLSGLAYSICFWCSYVEQPPLGRYHAAMKGCTNLTPIYFLSPPARPVRARKPVSKRPAMKSGWSRILRWRGIEV